MEKIQLKNLFTYRPVYYSISQLKHSKTFKSTPVFSSFEGLPASLTGRSLKPNLQRC